MSAEVDVPHGGRAGMIATMGGRWGGMGVSICSRQAGVRLQHADPRPFRWELPRAEPGPIICKLNRIVCVAPASHVRSIPTVPGRVLTFVIDTRLGLCQIETHPAQRPPIVASSRRASCGTPTSALILYDLPRCWALT